MENHLMDSVRIVLGLAAGGVIGYAFGLLQAVALRRHEQQQQSGEFKNGWTLFPGSGARVACLLLALALVQLVCPLLFATGTQWLVSAGVLVGYGWTLFHQMRRRLKALASS
jgi:hypothetical protein